MLSVYLYIWTWIEFYTITLIHPDVNFFLSKKLTLALKILFHSCSKESPLNWTQALGTLCSNKKEKREQFRTFLLSTPSPGLLLFQHQVCFLSLTLAVKLKFLQSTQIQLGIFLKAVVSYKVLYFSAEAAAISCCKGRSWFHWSLILDFKYLRLFQEQELTSSWSISKL